MSPQFQRVHLTPQYPIMDKFPYHLYSPRFLSIWCRFVLGILWNAKVLLPTTQFIYRKGLGTCDALLCVAHTLDSALEMGQEARIV